MAQIIKENIIEVLVRSKYLTREQLDPLRKTLADLLEVSIPAGLGSTGGIRLSHREMKDMLKGGAVWAPDCRGG